MNAWNLLASRIGRVTLCSLFLGAGPAAAISFSPFGSVGQGGALNGQVFDVGAGGSVFQMENFINIAGQDLNGSALGTSGRLGVDAIPSIGTSFSASLSPDSTDITLTFSLTNNTGSAVDLTFISFMDAEIDETLNTFFNETVNTSGVLAANQNFEADEPGFVSGDIFNNAMLGILDGTNSFPPADDVSMALSFDFLGLGAGATAVVSLMISEDLQGIGSFLMTQSDMDPNSTTTISFSGTSSVLTPVIPEPTAALVFALGAALVSRGLRRRQDG